ncbi:MAG: hypothetical protein Kow0075_11140 [Salibacteraceae bacterium]
MKQEEFSPEQSLRLIQTMINKARFNFIKGSFYFILWSVLLIAASIVEMVLSYLGRGDVSYLPWPIVGVLGGIVSMVHGFRSSRDEPVSYLERIYHGVWLSYFITLALLITSLVLSGTNPIGYILIVTGLPTYLTGFLLKFKPLLIGGVVFWVCGVVSLFMAPSLATPLFAISILMGYLVPGMIMRKSHSNDV